MQLITLFTRAALQRAGEVPRVTSVAWAEAAAAPLLCGFVLADTAWPDSPLSGGAAALAATTLAVRAKQFLPQDRVTMSGDEVWLFFDGSLAYQRFLLDGKSQCAVVRRYISRGAGGQWESPGGGEIMGNIRLDGWYCVAPGQDLDDATIKQIVRSLDRR